jgi:hypothetical protein
MLLRASFALIRSALALEIGSLLDRPLADSFSETKKFPKAQYVFPDCQNQSDCAASGLPRCPRRVGRGFSTNQVQNAGADSLWILDSSARFVLSAPAGATSCELRPIVMTSDCPGARSTSRARTNMITVFCMRKRHPDFARNVN